MNNIKVYVPVSGGKDSTACLLLALEFYDADEIVGVHNNTGWDHPETYKYLEYLHNELGVTIENTIYKEAPTIPDVIRKAGKFPFGKGRFCTYYLKQTAIYRYFKSKGLYQSGNVECWFGIRKNESNNRAKKYGGLSKDETYPYNLIYTTAPKSLSKHVHLRFPILDWSADQCFEFLKEKGIKPNPLYAEGTNDRVGCYPCLLAGKAAQESMFSTTFGQQQLQIIKDLEQKIGEKYVMYDTDQGSCENCKI